MDTPVAVSETPSSDIKEQHSGRRLHGFALFGVLSALMLTLLMDALDSSLIANLSPTIVDTFNGLDRFGWMENAYLLAAIIAIPVVGKLSDLFGRKWFLIFGTAIFVLASMCAGLAQTMEQVLVCRALQGFGVGAGISLVVTVVADIFPPAERPKWQALYWLAFGFSNSVGPILSGVIVEHWPLWGDLITDTTRWRWAFFLSVPIGVIALIALLIFLPSNLSGQRKNTSTRSLLRRIDFSGTVLSAVASVCLMFGLTWGSSQLFAWTSFQVLGLLTVALICYGLFLWVESRAAEAIIPLDLFRNRVFAADAVLSFMQRITMQGMFIFLPLFIQGVLAIPEAQSGRWFIPFAISMIIGSILSGLLIAIFKRYQLQSKIGTGIMALGMLLLVTQSHPDASIPIFVVSLVLAGLGVGSIFPVVTLAVQNFLPHSRLGVGTSTITYISQLAPILGIAMISTIVNQNLQGSNMNNLPSTLSERVVLGTALQGGFIVVFILSVGAFIATFFLKDIPMAKHFNEEK